MSKESVAAMREKVLDGIQAKFEHPGRFHPGESREKLGSLAPDRLFDLYNFYGSGEERSNLRSEIEQIIDSRFHGPLGRFDFLEDVARVREKRMSFYRRYRS